MTIRGHRDIDRRSVVEIQIGNIGNYQCAIGIGSLSVSSGAKTRDLSRNIG